MKIQPEDYFVSIGELSGWTGQTVPALVALAERIGIDRFDMQLNGVPYWNAINAERVLLGLAGTEAIDLTAPTNLDRLRDAIGTRTPKPSHPEIIET